MKLLDITDWMQTHYCVFCGNYIAQDAEKSICDACRLSWDYEVEEFGGAASILPQNLNSLTFLCGYVCEGYGFDIHDHSRKSLCRELVLSIKEERRPAAFNFIASELKERLTEKRLLPARDCIICSAPRSKKKLIEYGFDQSEQIAKRLSALTGIKYLPILVNCGSGVEQKKLNSGERFINAENNYTVNEKLMADCALKRVILVDDICTTGATLSSCAKLLRQCGARRVDGAVTARTFRQK